MSSRGSFVSFRFVSENENENGNGGAFEEEEEGEEGKFSRCVVMGWVGMCLGF